MTPTATTVLFNGAGASRFYNRPEYWGRAAFRSGLLPIEGRINNLFPAMSYNLVAGALYVISDDLISAVIPRGIRGRRPYAA